MVSTVDNLHIKSSSPILIGLTSALPFHSSIKYEPTSSSGGLGATICVLSLLILPPPEDKPLAAGILKLGYEKPLANKKKIRTITLFLYQKLLNEYSNHQISKQTIRE